MSFGFAAILTSRYLEPKASSALKSRTYVTARSTPILPATDSGTASMIVRFPLKNSLASSAIVVGSGMTLIKPA